jgi:AcrR family transcriptional regulator
LTARELYCVLLAVFDAPPIIEEGKMTIVNMHSPNRDQAGPSPDRLLQEVVDEYQDEIAELMGRIEAASDARDALVDDLLSDLERWLNDWENTCQWVDENPQRADRALSHLMAASNRIGGAMMLLEAIEPNHPALALAHERMDKAFTVADADLEWNVG